MSLKKYIVGGWVRDKLLTELGHPIQSNDKDWVVTGATPEEMLRLNFVPVGNDFPVQWRWMKRDTLLIPTAVSKT